MPLRRAARIVPLTLLALLAAPAANATDAPSFDVSFASAPKALPVRPAASAGLEARVASRDTRSGAPSFVWGMLDRARTAPSASLEQAARAHLRAHAALYGLSEAALATAHVTRIHDTGRGGVIVTFRQMLDGIPVLSHDAKVLMRADRSLVAISGNLRADALPVASRAPFSLPYEQAVALALDDRYPQLIGTADLRPSQPASKDDYQRFDLGQVAGVRFDQPARARQVYFPTSGGLVPAYYVETFTTRIGTKADAYAYVVDARDGGFLQRRNLTADAAFTYRVFADPTGDHRPLDGPIADFTPHPTGVPDGSYPPFVPSTLVTIDGFNQFADPWLAADATESRGNNVDAYTDHDDSNSVSGGDTRALISAPGELDYVYDTAQGPLASAEQQMAAVTQLFYTTNWLHDYWYDSGFDEPAGNAQIDNYGRGGDDGDVLRCEAQDAFDTGAINNANMATPADGASPRMQMYVWSGPQVYALSIDALGQTLESNVANFGPSSYDLTAEVALASDGTAPADNGCEAIVSDVIGKIALVDRGQCSFDVKAQNAQAAGAIGLLVANNQAGPPPFMPGSNALGVVIPLMSLTQADGALTKAALLNGPVTSVMHREQGAAADGTIDNLVVAHEWGHYLHHRLVDCGLNQCGGQSEGWGDFLALTLQIREGDDLDGVFSDAVYATIAKDNGAYFGTRRAPYSTDMAVNPFTFQHIQSSASLPVGPPLAFTATNNAEVHNTGEIWASMLFEGYVSLLAQSKLATPTYSFDEARRRMADYVVQGMLLAPVEPTFTEQRDAIIAAAYAADPDDAQLLAEGFAKRGAGSCAIAPPRDSFDNEGVVESFEVAPAVTVVALVLGEKTPCDSDGVLDAGEVGRVDVSLVNTGYLAATATHVSVASPTPGVTFPNGAELDVATIDGFGQADIGFDVAVPEGDAPAFIELVITAENPASCNPTVVLVRKPLVNFDTVLASSASDDFESVTDLWTPEGDASELIWSRDVEDSGNNLWHGVDYSSISDTALVSPALSVSASEPLVMTVHHRYKFEASEATPGDPQTFVYWDGGVIEISTDGGLSWDDVSTFVDPGYTGTIGNLADNPLADRSGFSGESLDWPALQPLVLDFGTALAGETVTFRFRIGTDQAASELGWELDDIGFNGITGTPFPSVVPDAQSCSEVDAPPLAEAGPDQVVDGGDDVTLDASQSSDPDGDELAFVWTQTAGPSVALTPTDAELAFTAPEVSEQTELTFQVQVTANGKTATDSVTVTVQAERPVDLQGGCDCLVARAPQRSSAPWAGFGAAFGLIAVLRRRNKRGASRSS